MPPPSLQLDHAYCVPVPALCGLVVAMVCDVPLLHVRVCAAVDALPSTVTEAPVGLACTVTEIGDGVTVEYWKFGGT